MMSLFRLAPAAAVAATLAATPLAGQRAAPQTYAITNARLVPVSGPAIEKGTIVIRNGLIAALGASVAVPGDARTIDGSGLTVYPGLIDAYSSLGVTAAAPIGGGGRGGAGAALNPAAAAIAALTRAVGSADKPAGFEPEYKVVDALKMDAEALAAPQAAGITAALSAPTTGVMQGQSAFINLAGDDAAAMIVRSGVAQHIGFNPARGGGYPNSLMGVFAALRQALLDAQHYREENAAYAKNPRGMRRPEFDAQLEALQPVIGRAQPVVMIANSQREIERALDLAKEFNLRVIIAGGFEAWKVADRLKADGVPVLLSLNFPRRATAASADADPDPIRVLKDRVETPKGAGRLATAGVKFAFQSGGMANWSDYIPNVQKAVENGLSAADALKAVTMAPAEILGVSDRLGSLEVGKIANLTVTRGEINDKSVRVTNVFIDGKPVTLRPPTVAGGPGGGGNFGGGNFGGAPVGVSGSWTVTVQLDGDDKPVTLLLRQDGTRLTGSLQGTLGTAEIVTGSAGTDGSIHFSVPITLREGTEEATFDGSIDQNAIKGRVGIVGHSPGTFSGTRPDRSGGRVRPPAR